MGSCDPQLPVSKLWGWSSDNVLKLFLIFFHTGEHSKTATCPFWSINLFLQASTSSKYNFENPSHLKISWLKKKHFTKYFEISKRGIPMFTFVHSNFEWKHWNLRLRLHPHWIKIINKYKMIAKMIWPLIQVNLPLMFYINETPILSQ